MPIPLQLPFDLVLTDVLAIGGTVVGFWVIRSYFQYREIVNSIDHLVGLKSFFSAATVWTRFLPNIPYINRKNGIGWKTKYGIFQEYRMDILSSITFWPSPKLLLHVADPGAVKEIMTNRGAFVKPTHFYKVLEIYGPNILSTEGDEWRRHRKVVAQSFTERNNQFIWLVTINYMSKLFDIWDEKHQTKVVVENAADLTRELALMVIGTAAFGMNLSWNDEGTVPTGYTMSFKTMLHYISVGFIHRAALPNWILSLYPFGRKTKTAYAELEQYIGEMVKHRLSQPGHQDDLFSNLLRAREEEKDGQTIFTDSDVLGNTAVLMFAGHETSANTLALALAGLAAHPEVQERFRAEILENSIDGQMPEYSEISKLTYGLAIIYETLRLVPITPVIPKQSAYDTKFTPRTADGSGVYEFRVPQGTNMIVSLTGLHYNTKYWDDPSEFRPERFLGDWDKYAWVPFSSGPRACLGRRFAEIEMLATLAMLVKNYDIRVNLLPGESMEGAKKRVMDAGRATLLLHAKKTALVFIRR